MGNQVSKLKYGIRLFLVGMTSSVALVNGSMTIRNNIILALRGIRHENTYLSTIKFLKNSVQIAPLSVSVFHYKQRSLPCDSFQPYGIV